MRGPSALGGGWPRFRRLVWRMSRTELATRYHNSVLGYLWTLLGPLLMFAVLYVAFTRVVRFGGGVEHYASLLLFNIMLFHLFTESTGKSIGSLVSKTNILRRAHLPRLVIPLSIALTSLFTYCFAFLLSLGFAFATGVSLRWTWLLAPFAVLGVFIFTVGCGLLVSALYVRYRDIQPIWSAVARGAFYASPILFPVELFPENFHFILFVNPLAPLFIDARVWLFDPNAPTYGEALGGSIYYLGPALIGLGICALGVWYFFRRAPEVAEEL